MNQLQITFFLGGGGGGGEPRDQDDNFVSTKCHEYHLKHIKFIRPQYLFGRKSIYMNF